MNARGSPTAGRWRPWVALLLAPATWAVFEYGLGSALRGHCVAVGAWLGPVWGVASLLACCLAVAVAWPMARPASAARPAVRPWMARVAAFEAGIFMLAIIYQTLATLIVPSCAR